MSLQIGPRPGPEKHRSSGSSESSRVNATTNAPKLKKFWAWRDLPSFIWLVLAVLCALGHRWLPEPRWLLIHLVLLGAASHAILVWSQHFSFALLHAPVTVQERFRQSWRLAMFNIGVVIVFTGVLIALWPVTLCGAALVSAAVVWHAVSLLGRFRRAVGVRFAVTIWYYVVAAAALPIGATIGVLLAHGFADPLHGQLKTGHALLNVLGWIGLTVLGTLVTLWPTMLRTKLHADAVSTARRVLWVFIAGLVIAAASVLCGSLWGTTAGLLVYLVALCWLGSIFVRTARQRPPSAFCTLSVAAGLSWLALALVFLLVGFTRGAIGFGGWDTAYEAFSRIAPFLAAGFVAQVLIGALAYLIPVMVSTGPASARAANAEMERGSVYRVVLANAALVLSVLPVPSVVLVLATMLYLGATASFLVLMIRSMRAARHPQLPTNPTVPAPTSTPAASAGTTNAAISSAGSRSLLQMAATTVKPCCDACAEAPADPEKQRQNATAFDEEGTDARGTGTQAKSADLKGRNPYGDKPRGSAAGQAVAAILTIVLAIGIGIAADPSALGAIALGSASTSSDTQSDPDSQAAAGDNAPQQTIAVEARDMEFYPASIEVVAGTDLTIELTNTDTTNIHDLVFENGLSTGRIAVGDTATIKLGVITEDLDGWCSILGHKQMGMKLAVTVTGPSDATAGESTEPSDEAGESSESDQHDDSMDHSGTMTPNGTTAGSAADDLDFSASPSDTFSARDASLDRLPAATGTPVTRKLTFDITEQEMEVAPGVTQTLWTFNGQFPGPTLHGRVGDIFEITLVNHGSMGHSIDFHASNLAPNKPMRTIAPGETLTYTFTAERAGIWMYHCSTKPMTAHIANGMAGAVIIEPDDLPEVDRSYVIVQSEMYLGAQGEPVDVDKALGGDSNLDAVVFNGYVNQYVARPLEAHVGERVRIWTLDVGPSRASSFHVVGGQFDRVWLEGQYILGSAAAPSTGQSGGSQALALQPAQGGFVELVFPEPGDYPFVTHIMADAERGAKGLFEVAD